MTTELAKAKEQTRMLAATEHHTKDEVLLPRPPKALQ